jgi:hypothetical protein
MKIELSDLLIGIKNGRTSRRELKGLIDAINQTKLNKKILENIHLGLSNFSDKEVAQFVNTLK